MSCEGKNSSLSCANFSFIFGLPGVGLPKCCSGLGSIRGKQVLPSLTGGWGEKERDRQRFRCHLMPAKAILSCLQLGYAVEDLKDQEKNASYF